jgi:hypothetical protein
MQTHKSNSTRRFSALLVLLAAPLACARVPDEPEHSGSADANDPSGEQAIASAERPRQDVDLRGATLQDLRTPAQSEALLRVARQVPHAIRNDECVSGVDRDTCAWAQSADALVVATVRAVRLATTPIAGPAEGGPWKWYDACKKVAPALEIDLDVEHDLAAKVAGVTTVRVGKRQLDNFAPGIKRSKDGSVKWNVAEGEAGPLQPGQRVLAALHYVKGQKVWSLMGEMLAAIDSEGIVRTPRAGCLSRLPKELDQKGLPTVVDRLKTCVAQPVSTAAVDLGAQRLRAWGDDPASGASSHPANYMAAECLEPDFVPHEPNEALE